jgi:hypothetical protein
MNSVHSLASVPAAAPELKPVSSVSEARLAANKANAQLSTGATSPEGKAKSSLNAVKTALTGRTILLPTEDAAAYEQYVREYAKDLSPEGQRESDLVQSIADSSWRLQRIPVLEAAIYAQGRIQFDNHFDEYDASLRSSLIDLQTHLTYEKQLRNLHIQEARLHRRREKDLAELRELQKERNQNRKNALEAAFRLYTLAKRANQPFDLAQLGFEFSMDDLQAYTDGDPVSQMIRAAQKRIAQGGKITQSAA